ncbi:MAG: hypothetical protein JKY53_08500 [Flavobacteriales bacterium]|nr:hypothetical protein [Flavobacteriales bacterium]
MKSYIHDYRIKMKYTLAYVGFALLFYTSCNKLEPHEPTAGDADFTTVVAIGGNYLSGYSDGAISKTSQENSLANLIAVQLQEAGGGEFNQPTIDDENGLGLSIRPWDSDFHSKSHLGDRTDCEGGVSFGPVKSLFDVSETSLLQSVSGTFHNYAIPYVAMNQYDDVSLGLSHEEGGSPFYHRFVSTAGTSSLIDEAIAADPSFAILWLGMEEIYGYAMRGGTGAPIPLPGNTKIDSILNALSTKGANGVIATIPSIESYPYFNLIPYNGANMTKNQADSLNDVMISGGPDFDHIRFAEGDNGFVFSDSTYSVGVGQMQAGDKLLFSVPLDSIKCSFVGLLARVIPDIHSLDKYELAIIENAIVKYNDYITLKALEHNFALADINSYFKEVEIGVLWNGVNYNLEFVSGGFISLDGYHLTTKGYAMVANEFINAINDQYAASVPLTICPNCRGTQFPNE